MQNLSPRYVIIGAICIDLASNELVGGGGSTRRLSPKAADVLRVLLANPGCPVHRDRLLELVWGGRVRTDDVISKAIYELRKALGDNSGSPVIENLPRVGYRLREPWKWADQPATELTDEAAGTRVATEPVQPVKRLWRLPLIVVLLAMAVGSTLILLHNAEPPVSLATAAATTALHARALSGDTADEGYAAISPDGKWVAVSQQGPGATPARLVIRGISGNRIRVLTEANSAGDPVVPHFSPDGAWVAYERASADACQIEIVSVLGGAPRVATGCAVGVSAALEYFPDGESLLLPRVGGPAPDGRRTFERLDLESGKRSNYEYGAEPASQDVEGRFSPDGRLLLIRRGAAPNGSLWLLDVGKGQTTELCKMRGAVHGMTWLSDNRHVLLASDTDGPMGLWRLDTETGDIERLAGLLGQFPDAARQADTVVYRLTNEPTRIQAFPYSPVGEAPEASRRIFASTGAEWEPTLSPDETTMAFVSDRTGSAQIFTGDMASGDVQQVTNLARGAPHGLVFSADSRYLVFSLRSLERSEYLMVDRPRQTTSRVGPWSDGLIDLSFAAQPQEWLYARLDEHGQPRIFRGKAGIDGAALQGERPLSSCPGRAPIAVGDEWVYFSAADYRAMMRVPANSGNAQCEMVSNRIKWWNRAGWGIHESRLLVYLSPPLTTANGIYEIKSPTETTPLLLIDSARLFVPSGARFDYGSREAYATVAAHEDADIMVLTTH